MFNDLPLLLAVPRAAQLLGISRAAAYRLVASGELPIRRLGGRVYVVTIGPAVSRSHRERHGASTRHDQSALRRGRRSLLAHRYRAQNLFRDRCETDHRIR